MDSDLLREHLTKLHAELDVARRADPDTHRLLDEIKNDIQRLTTESATHPALPERLEKIAVLFEVDHPVLAASSRRLVDLLGKAGL